MKYILDPLYPSFCTFVLTKIIEAVPLRGKKWLFSELEKGYLRDRSKDHFFFRTHISETLNILCLFYQFQTTISWFSLTSDVYIPTIFLTLSTFQCFWLLSDYRTTGLPASDLRSLSMNTCQSCSTFTETFTEVPILTISLCRTSALVAGLDQFSLATGTDGSWQVLCMDRTPLSCRVLICALYPSQ
jgi:hypothetical protein